MTSFPYRLARLLGAPLRWLFGVLHSTIHGDARFMSRLEMGRAFRRHHRGLVLSPRHRMSLEESFRNLALVAPTGSGKTTRYVIPNVLEAEGSLVITDPSGELFARTSRHLQERGFRVQVLQPADLSHSLRFNPLTRCKTPQQLRQLATILGQNGSSAGSDPFWTTTAVNLLYLGLSAIAAVEEPRFRNLGNLRWVLNHMGGVNVKGIHWFFSKHLRDEALFAEYLAFLAQDSKVMASILASARACLELWSDPDVCRLTATDSVALENLRKVRTAFYLIVPEHRVRYFSIILNLLYSQCFALCLEDGGRPDSLPVLFFLDEVGNLGRVYELGAIMTTLRKRRCSVSLILQELSQLTAVYGPAEARTIFAGGCGSKLFFSGLDLEASRYIEGLLGSSTEYDTLFGGIDERARTIGVPLMRSDHVRMMKGQEAVLICGSRRPARVKMPPYFEVGSWSRAARKGPARLSYPDAGKKVDLIDLNESWQLTSVAR